MSASTTVLIFEELSENQKNFNLLQNIGLFDLTLEGFSDASEISTEV